MINCIYSMGWKGVCIKVVVNGDYCKDHHNLKCVSCGEQAIRQCTESSSFVCGAPLCGDCEHKRLGHGKKVVKTTVKTPTIPKMVDWSIAKELQAVIDLQGDSDG